MWFLAPVSTQPLTKISIFLGTNIIKSVDQGWLEILGGQGAFMARTQLFQANQQFQVKSFNFFVITILLVVLLLVCLYSNSL